jgi:hypothetical protein
MGWEIRPILRNADHDFTASVPRSGTPRSGFVQQTENIRAGPHWGARTKRKIKHGKERNLLVDASANLGQQG